MVIYLGHYISIERSQVLESAEVEVMSTGNGEFFNPDLHSDFKFSPRTGDKIQKINVHTLGDKLLSNVDDIVNLKECLNMPDIYTSTHMLFMDKDSLIPFNDIDARIFPIEKDEEYFKEKFRPVLSILTCLNIEHNIGFGAVKG